MHIINKIILSLTILICVGNTSLAQHEKMMEKHRLYNTYLTKGLTQRINSNYLEAIPYYDSASTVFPAFHKPYYELVICHANLDNFQAAYDNVVKMTLTGMRNPIIPEALCDFVNSSLYKQFLQGEDSLYKSAMKKLDTHLCNTIQYLHDLDQASIGKKSTQAFHQLVKFCKEYGFPTYKKVGFGLYRSAMSIVFNAVHSYPSDDWMILFPLIQNEIEQGNMETELPCAIEDSYLSSQGQPVKYGIYYRTNKNIILPSLEELNRNRAKAGLANFELQIAAERLNLDEVLERSKN